MTKWWAGKEPGRRTAPRSGPTPRLPGVGTNRRVTLQSQGDSLPKPSAVSNGPPKTGPTFLPRHPPPVPSRSRPAVPSCGPEKWGVRGRPAEAKGGAAPRRAGSRPGSALGPHPQAPGLGPPPGRAPTSTPLPAWEATAARRGHPVRLWAEWTPPRAGLRGGRWLGARPGARAQAEA